jgi:hypothetical protein
MARPILASELMEQDFYPKIQLLQEEDKDVYLLSPLRQQTFIKFDTGPRHFF